MERAEFSSAARQWEERRVRHSHDHPPLRNINQLHQHQLTAGERVADGFAEMIGSWTFIMAQTAVLAIWIVLNAVAWSKHWDPYPFILLNLALSFQAAYAAPIIMMSQNRQADKDRLMAEQDYEINEKAEQELKDIMHHLEQQDEVMIDILTRLESQQRLLIAAHQLLDPGSRPPEDSQIS
jgi:uncharacterized membrane protein